MSIQGRLPLVLQWGLGVLISVVLGILVATAHTWPLLAGAVPVAAWVAYRYPPLTIIAFWCLYVLQTTVFASVIWPQGIYYPLYLMMGVNFIAYLGVARAEMKVSRSLLFAYAAFFGVVCVSLLWQPPGVFVNTLQRLFIYGLGVLTLGQIRSRQHVKVVYGTMIVSALVVSVWTILEARAAFFGYRGGLDVNQNYIATLITFGLVPLLSLLTDKAQRTSTGVRVCLWGVFLVGVYALLILASRGVTVAFLVAGAVVLLQHGVRRPGRMVMLLLAIGLCVSVLFELPGARNLVERMNEAKTDSFNDRLPLWGLSLQQFAEVHLYEQLLGQGMGSSELMVNAINPTLTSLHNGYLQILFEFGIAGFLVFAHLIQMAIRAALKLSGYIGTAGIALLIFMLVATMSATFQDGALFWIALGITFSRSKQVQEVTHAA